jgi:hypothetical protein
LGRKLSTDTTIKQTIPKSFALLKYFEQAGWEDSWVEKAEELVCTEFKQSYKYMDGDFLFAPINSMVVFKGPVKSGFLAQNGLTETVTGPRP